MVLHIAIDGAESEFKTSLIKELYNHLTKHDKKYKVAYIELPKNEEILNLLGNYNLMNHEIALLMATDYSIEYYNNDFHEYDFVIWQRTIITNYVYNTDENTPRTFIKQINKYSPIMDLTLIIDNTSNSKYLQYCNPKNKIIPVTNLEEIIQTFDKYLPKCNWCGRYFRPTQQHRKYCSQYCSEEALKEQYRINNREYYRKWKDTLTERQRGALGSKNANLHGTADPNPIAELEKVRNAKKSLGLKPIH